MSFEMSFKLMLLYPVQVNKRHLSLIIILYNGEI